MGKARVTIRLAGWPEGQVAASHHEIEVVAPRRAVFEAISSRLKESLIFPAKKSYLHGVRYSPDGTRIIAGDYPGGVVQVWDPSGKQLVKIETGFGYHSSKDYFLLSPDWKTLYSCRGKLSVTVVEKEHKRSNRYEADGDVRAWDVSTGELRATFKHDPPRAIHMMLLSPDGLSFVSFEYYYGESGQRLQSGTLWDVKSRQRRPLPADFQGFATYSPDGQKLVAHGEMEAGRAAVKLLELATGQVRQLTVAIAEKECSILGMQFSPDGSLLIGDAMSRRDQQRWLKFWDASTGRELASFAASKNDMFLWLSFSPNGRMLASANRGGFQSRAGKLFLFDLPGRKLATEVPLGEKTCVGEPAFSPDGKWIAVPTQAWPDGPPRGKADPEDLPQPRIYLVEAAAGAVRETLVAPPGLAGCACFSPDGKTLATTSLGKVLLWDLSKPPNTSQTRDDK